MRKIQEVANANQCKLMICHVLRYAPFYRKAREIIDSGVLGEIMNMQSAERVGAFHSSVSYLRGKWADCGSSLLLAKCCHDIDLLCWFNNKTTPKTVYSNGGRDYFVPEKAPKGAERNLWIQGTKGEVEGEAGEGILKLYEYNKKTSGSKLTIFNFNETSGETAGHFGGDRRLIDDFCALMEGEQPSVSCTSIDDSVWGHFACYSADASQETKEIVTIGSGK